MGLMLKKSIFEDFHQLLCRILSTSFPPLTVTTVLLSFNFPDVYWLCFSCLDLVDVNRGAWCFSKAQTFSPN